MDELEPKSGNQQKERRLDPDLLKKGLRCDLDQYDMLKRCSDRKDMTEWNEWRKKNPNEDVFLQGANLSDSFLRGAFICTKPQVGAWGKGYLQGADLRNSDLQTAKLSTAYLEGARLFSASLDRATLDGAQLQRADLEGVHATRGSFIRAILKCANLTHAVIKDANFLQANLEGAILMDADLRGSCLMHSNLDRADLEDAALQRTLLSGASLEGTRFTLANVDGSTVIWKPKVNSYRKNGRYTNMDGVALNNVHIDAGTKQLLEYNIRRKNWEDWYKEHPRLKWLVKPFWLMSDYGLSTARIIVIFFGAAFIFANIYYHWGRIAPPGIIDNLFVDRSGIAVPWWLVPLRALYFSIITMTLGFSDMYASVQSVWGHILITVQALLGYVLLGALVTRFAVLFTAGGPAGKFADEKEKATEDRGQKTEDGGRRTEDRGRRTEDGGQKTEDRRQRTEDRGQKTEDRRWR